ncbi:unnamed protein product [Cuscuta campestris]|uniref:MADS-box domain-containing protein n=1 Tax=Cuscuta campestris TaxID=132261 RepID=A0A484NLN3_9ASTE|nr:unnamed protein product [Cuscuta campestris]
METVAVMKKTRGRQKIPMRKIENEGDRFATFSKRRKGFYKKASELSWISGADIGIVLTSPTGKIFSFFNPSPDSITGRLFNRGQWLGERSLAIDARSRAAVDELYGAIDDLESHMEAVNQRSKVLDLSLRRPPPPQGRRTWWEEDVAEFTAEEVERYQAFLEGLQNGVSSCLGAAILGAPPVSAAAPHEAAAALYSALPSNEGNNI